jgi:hypothetical protein
VHTTNAFFAVDVYIIGHAGGGMIPSLTLSIRSATQPDATSGTLSATAMLPPGTYGLDVGTQGAVGLNPTTPTGSFDILVNVTLSIGGAPPPPPEDTCKPPYTWHPVDLPALCIPLVIYSSPGWSAAFGNGAKLEVTCSYLDYNNSGFADIHPIPAYTFWYTNPQGQRAKIAQCLFSGGGNYATFRAGVDAQGRSCLKETTWVNIDRDNEDVPKFVHGFQGEDIVFTTPQEP